MPFEGNSLLEGILRKALQNENISFVEQYRIYEKGDDLKPKYTLDFLVYTENCKINVECDGWAYHKSKEDKNKDALRDLWILQRGIDYIIRFDTIDIKYNINGCINQIKRLFMKKSGISYDLKPENPYIEEYRKINRSGYIININDISKLHNVSIYTATCAFSYNSKGKGAIAYQLEDNTLNVLGKEHSLAFANVTRKECQAIVILKALEEMKLPANLIIYTESKWIASIGNNNKIENATRNVENRETWIKIDSELKKHNYKFLFKIENDTKTYKALLSRSKQKAYRALDSERITI